MVEIKRKRWNLWGVLATLVVILGMVCLIRYGQEYKELMKIVLSVLSVILTVAFFAIIRNKVKTFCEDRLEDKNKRITK